MSSKSKSGLPAFMKGLKTSFILSFLLTSILFSGCTLMPAEEEILAPPVKEPPKVTYETVEVTKGSLEKKIKCTGNFVSVSREDAVFRYSGNRLERICVKYGDKVNKGDLIAVLETESINERIEMQKLVVQKAQLYYDKVRTEAELNGGGSKFDLESCEIELEMAKLSLQNLYKELDKSRLYAQSGGDVVYVKEAKQGDYIEAYDVIASIADPRALQLTYRGERVSDFRNGMKVDVTIKNVQYEGEVVATPSDAPLDATSEEKESVRIKVKDLPDAIERGDDASISIILDKREDVVVLPRHLVSNFSGSRFVNVLVNGIREERPVEMGLQTDTEVEIVKGLEAGELVIVR